MRTCSEEEKEEEIVFSPPLRGAFIYKNMKTLEKNLKPLDFALKLEETGRAFYLERASKMHSELAKKIFLSISEEELKHIERINKIYATINKGGEIKDSGWEKIRIEKGKLSDIFKSTLKGGSRTQPTSSEQQAIKTAMDNETRGYNFYDKTARQTNDADVRTFFEILMKEENVHFKILQDTYEYLFDTADWFIKSEGRTIEGG